MFLCAPKLDELLSVTAMLVIVVRGVTLSLPLIGNSLVTDLIDSTQTVNMGISVITNVVATSVISLQAW